MNCGNDGCEEQIGYDQYDSHIDQCQFKYVICEHCNQKYQRRLKNDHDANCLDLIKLKNTELSAKLEQSQASELKLRSELANIKRTNSKRTIQNREKSDAKARPEFELIKSQFQNANVVSARYKYFENDVFATQLKPATTTSYDSKGRSQKNFDYFKSNSAKEQFRGAKIYVKHEHHVHSGNKEDWIFLSMSEKEKTTKMIEAEWNTKVWQNGKLLLDRDYQYTFEMDTGGWGNKVETNSNESEFFVIVTIKKWNVTTK